MLHTVVPLGVVFPNGYYPSEQGLPDAQAQPNAECISDEPISTNLSDHLKKRGE